MKKLLRAFVLLLVLSTLLHACAKPGNDNRPTQTETLAPLLTPKPAVPFGYDKLSKEQQDVYDLLVRGGITEEKPYPLAGGEEPAALILYQMNVNRVSSWNTAHYRVAYDEETLSRPEAIVATEGFDNRGNYESILERFNAKTEEYLSLLPGKEADDYTKAKAIATLLCEKVSFNYSADPYSGVQPTNDAERESARYASQDYGAIVNGSAICTGYAAAFQYLCGLLDVYSIYVEGFAGANGIGHAWNMVYIDGAYYHVDVTFMGTGGTIERYFLLSDDEISVDHHGMYYGDQGGWSFDPYLAELFRIPSAGKRYGE